MMVRSAFSPWCIGVFVLRYLSVFICALFVSSAQAQTAAPGPGQPYPSRLIRIVVPWPAGGTTDIIGRIIGQKLNESLAQPVIIDNRPGASGSVGSEIVARAAPDGYTLLVVSMGTLTMNQFVSKLSYDPVNDLAPISLVANVPAVLASHPSLPVSDIRGLIALARAKPGQLNVASGSNAYELAIELLKMRGQLDMVHVRYKGGGAAINDLLGGHMMLVITGAPAVTPHVKSKKLRMLAVTTSKRAIDLPDVPTIGETLPGYEFNNWTGILAPAGTPRPVMDKLNAEVVHILELPAVHQTFRGLGAEPTRSTQQEFGRVLRSDAEKWGKLIKATGFRPD